MAMGKMSRQWQRERMRRKRASIKWERACWEVAREYQREGNLKHMRKALQGLVKMRYLADVCAALEARG